MIMPKTTTAMIARHHVKVQESGDSICFPGLAPHASQTAFA